MSEIQQDLYHEILDSLITQKLENTILFDQITIKNNGTDKISAYSMQNANEDIIEYFMVSPNTPITDIDNLNKFMTTLLTDIEPTIKENAETYYKKPIIPILKNKQRLNIGKMIFKQTYHTPAIDYESNKKIKIPFNIKCILEIFPNNNYLDSGKYEWNQIKELFEFEKRTTIPWPLK
ncbi:MAG: hypothetical protein GQ477_03165 [Nanohaloarchaea archaeon]|nr:hypothetical protein [Candidatus Nanohaloarchaea archaeon]